MSSPDKVESLIKDFLKYIRENDNTKNSISESITQPKKKRGRRKGQTGITCNRIRYKLREVQDNRIVTIGDFCTLREIADHYGYSYQKICHIYKQRHKLSKIIKIIKLPD